jgi:glycosyltransferase involved in cell wall biosynthesis
MAAGVPCVATDVGDCAYIIGDTGQVVPAGDMAGFASCMVALLRLAHIQRADLGERARARVASNFEIGGIVRQYEKSYESLRKNVG